MSHQCDKLKISHDEYYAYCNGSHKGGLHPLNSWLMVLRHAVEYILCFWNELMNIK